MQALLPFQKMALTASKISLIPEARIFWQHEFLDNPRLIGATLDGGAGPGFNFQTSTPDRDSVFTGVGVTAQFGDEWNSFFFYNADFGRQDFVSHAISAGLALKF
jgi:outer membrane autotransporter protein